MFDNPEIMSSANQQISYNTQGELVIDNKNNWDIENNDMIYKKNKHHGKKVTLIDSEDPWFNSKSSDTSVKSDKYNKKYDLSQKIYKNDIESNNNTDPEFFDDIYKSEQNKLPYTPAKPCSDTPKINNTDNTQLHIILLLLFVLIILFLYRSLNTKK